MFDNCLGDSRQTIVLLNDSSGKTRPNNSFIKLASCLCPIIQYGVLDYGCCSFSSFSPIYHFQKRIIKVIDIRKRHDDSEDLFTANKILTLFELHIYELLKFILKSLNHMHSEDYLNITFQFESCTHSTRRAVEKTISHTSVFRKCNH